MMDRVNYMVMIGDSYRALKDYNKAREYYNQGFAESLRMENMEMPQAMVQGMTASRFTFVPSVRQRLHTGPIAGITVRYDVERGASLQAELNYRRGGWQERYDSLATSYSRTLDYLELPLLTHLYFRSGDIRIFINAGPFFGYQLGESATSSGEANMSALDSTRHGMAVRDRFFWGLGGGPGISIPIGKRQRVELEGRFVYGLGNLWSSKRGSTYVQSSEMYFGATLNYFFRL